MLLRLLLLLLLPSSLLITTTVFASSAVHSDVAPSTSFSTAITELYDDSATSQRRYATLELAPSSDFAAVQKAFRKLGLAHRPDRGDTEVKRVSEEYKTLNSHYQCRLKTDDHTLSPTQAAWKERRALQWGMPPPPPPAPSPPPPAPPIVDGRDDCPNEISTGEIVRTVLGVENLGANVNVYVPATHEWMLSCNWRLSIAVH